MDHNKVKILLNDYVDDILPDDLVKEVESHILECKECNNFHLSLRALLERASSTPDSIEPPENLWGSIYEELREMEIKNTGFVDEEAGVQNFGDLKGAAKKPEKEESPDKTAEKIIIRKEKTSFGSRPIIFALIIIAVAVLIYFFVFRESNPWKVSLVSGNPTVSNEKINSAVNLPEDEILINDYDSRALIKIPKIGSIHLNPNSKIKRLDDFSFRLIKGDIKVTEKDAKEFLTVEIPSAKVQDFNLGNEYNLNIDANGNGSIYVGQGWVRISNINKEAIIPSKHYCKVRKGVGPGIPYSASASPALKDALDSFGFKGDMNAIPVILSESKENDTISLWHLLQRADSKDRLSIYNKLSEFVKPPAKANKDEILSLNRKMLIDWLEKIDLQL